MNTVFTNCSRCGKDIHYGNAYVTILRNIEQAEKIAFSEDVETDVIDSREILTLCGKCGNSFNSDAIAQVINAIPMDGREIGWN